MFPNTVLIILIFVPRLGTSWLASVPDHRGDGISLLPSAANPFIAVSACRNFEEEFSLVNI